MKKKRLLNDLSNPCLKYCIQYSIQGRELMKLDRSQVDRVEKDISPPMRYGITIPVTDKGQDTGVSVYVAVTPFMLGDSHRKSKARHFMKEVAKALYLS